MKRVIHRCWACLALVALTPWSASAQRHGRPDSVQNYTKSMRPSNAELALNFDAAHKWVYFHLTDLRQMKRTAIDTTDPAKKVSNMYEGVSLRELVSGGLTSYRFEVFQEFWAFRDKRVLSSDDLDLESDIIVADTVNGKKLARDSPFCFAAKDKRGDLVVVKKLAYIKFSGTP